MAYDTDTFRACYRAGIHPAYSALLHGGFVFVYAAAWLVYYVRALGALVAATFIGSYLTYEIFHTCQHLPDTNPLTRLPLIRTMRRHHALHHRRALMTSKNFNLVVPLVDVLRGTLHREGDAEPMQAEVDA